MGIFAQKAEKYWDQGWSVFPGKRVKDLNPGATRDIVVVPSGWSTWCKRLPNEDERAEFLLTKGDWGLTVACGPASNLVALDVDATDAFPEIDKITRDVVPESPVERVGSKGFAAIYRFDSTLVMPQLKASKEQCAPKEVLVEILANNKHCFIPPTFHAWAGRPYVWTGDDLMFYTPKDLPLLTQSHLDLLKITISDYVTGNGWSMSGAQSSGLFTPKFSPDGRRCPHGAHNDLNRLCSAKIHDGKPIDDIIQEIYEYDQSYHDVPYFSQYGQVSDCPYPDAKKNTALYCMNMAKTLMENDKVTAPGFKADLPDEKKYPTKAMGFYFPSKNQDGVVSAGAPDFNGFAKHFKDKYNAMSGPALTYIWNGSFYRHIEQTEFESILYTDTNERIKPKDMTNFYRICRAANFADSSKIVPPLGYLNLKNGVLDIDAGKIVNRDKKYFFLNEINLLFDKDARCPRFDWYLDDVFEGDADRARMLQMFMGHVLMQGKPKLHKALVLFGDGENGKSAFINILHALFGNANISNVSMSKLDHQFSTVGLMGRMLNLVDETPASRAINSEIFKTAVSGGRIQTSFKGIDSFFMTVQARFGFSCNDFPVFQDASHGLYRRLLIVPFSKLIEKVDTTLEDDIIGGEMPGVLNWALEGYRMFVENNYKIPEAQASVQIKDDYMCESDSVQGFIKERIRKKPGDIMNYTSRELFGFYERWCNMQSSKNPVNADKFARRLRGRIKHYQPTVEVKKSRHGVTYSGITVI